FSTLLVLLTLAIEKQLPRRQFDVKDAFLYTPLKEILYIKTPEGSKRKAPFLRLKKSLYGLKQAPANWFEMLTSWLKEINYTKSASDPCLFSHQDGDSFVFFHVDDLIVAGKVDGFQEMFLSRFPNSSAHDPDTLLGMKLNQTADTVTLSQPKLIRKGLELKRNYLFLEILSRALNSKKQKNISLSSTEAELNALSDGAQESQWITYLIEELWKEKLDPAEFNIDNQGLLEKIKNFGSNSKTKHIDIKMKWLCELKNSDQINLKLIPSEEMVADALTKASNADSLKRLQAIFFLVLFSPT
ncbi:hypothetical protein VP01_6624g1, partial [Puccinia sorghi]